VADWLEAFSAELKGRKPRSSWRRPRPPRPRYGDQDNFTPIREPEIEAEDRAMLAPLQSADQEAFFQKVAAIEDRRAHLRAFAPLCGAGRVQAGKGRAAQVVVLV